MIPRVSTGKCISFSPRNPPAGERAAHGFAARVCHLHPKSRGTLRLRTADPSDAPAIDPRFLSEASDLVSMQSGVERMCEISEQQPLKQLVKRNMDVAAFSGQAALIKWIRAALKRFTIPSVPAEWEVTMVLLSIASYGSEGWMASE